MSSLAGLGLNLSKFKSLSVVSLSRASDHTRHVTRKDYEGEGQAEEC